MSTDPMDDPEVEGYSLTMPFVVTLSHGGPYDDGSFVAGFEAGHLAAELAMCAAMPQGVKAVPGQRYVHRGIVAQLDLIAMQNGFTLTAEHHDDEWSLATFTIAEEEL